LGAAIGVAALATLAVVFLLPIDAWQQALAVLAVLAWAAVTFWVVALGRSRFAITELRLAPDLVLVVRMGDGRLVAGHVRSSTYVGAWVTTIVWRADGTYWSRTVLVLPDMLAAEDFRRLRVMLRYARNAVAQGVPASQA
jgi:cyanate permease